MKYAFIMNSSSLNPDSYSTKYNDGKNEYYFAAVHGMKMTSELSKKLADEGYELIDLCGDYDAEKSVKVSEAAEGKIKVNYAKYTDEDQTKLDKLESMGKYGIIVLAFDPTDDVVRLELESEEYNTYIDIVSTEEMASRQANEMVAEGVNFIELCSYFDKEKAAEISEAISGKMPVGYCG